MRGAMTLSGMESTKHVVDGVPSFLAWERFENILRFFKDGQGKQLEEALREAIRLQGGIDLQEKPR